MFIKKALAMLCAAAMLGCLLAPAASAAAAAPASGTLRILFTHDMHDHILPWQTSTDGGVQSVGGYARLKTAIDENRTDTSILVDGGDFSMGTLFNGVFATDAPDLTLLGMLGYDAVTLGNHEFDYGPEVLAKSLTAAKNPPQILSANIQFADAADSQTLKAAFDRLGGARTKLVEKNGVKIGLFGITGDEAASDIAYPGSVTFSDRFEAAKQSVAALQQQGAQVIVCLSHSGTAEKAADSEDIQLAKKVSGIDVILSGHSHTLLKQPIVVGSTTIVSCGCYGQYLGVLDLDLASKKQVKYETLPITADFAADPAVQGQIERYEQDVNTQFLAKYDLKFDDVIAESPIDFDDVNVNYNEFRDSNMGDIVADAHVFAYQQNGGTERPIGISAKGIVRAALYKGNVALNDSYSVTAVGKGPDGTIGDPLALVYLSGNELRQTCEIVASMQNGNTQMYFSGMRYTYMNARPFGDKVIDVEVQNADGSWVPAEKEKLYPVVANLYIAQMLPVVTKQTHNLFSIVPKDSDGKAVEDVTTLTLHDKNGAELKDWISLVEYLRSFPQNENGVSVIPASYETARATKTALPFSLGKYFTNTSKLGFIIYGALVLAAVIVVLIVRAVVKKKKKKAPVKQA